MHKKRKIRRLVFDIVELPLRPAYTYFIALEIYDNMLVMSCRILVRMCTKLDSKVGYTQSATNTAGKTEKDCTPHFIRGHQGTRVEQSTTAWCFFECAEDPTVLRVIVRMVTITVRIESTVLQMQLIQY